MRLLIRYMESRGAGKATWESRYEGDSATIGRGTDQTISLPGRRVPLEHSKLTLKAGQLRLAAMGDHRFSVNDAVSKNSVVAIGDEVIVAGHTLHFLPAEQDHDCVIEVELESGEVESLRDRFKTRLWQLAVPERSISWVLFLAILAIGVVIPATGFFVGMSALRESPLPDDSLWLAGGLHQTHAFMGDECSYCHTVPFVPAKDEDCLYCHLSVNHHFDTTTLGRDYKAGDRCADCHHEHTDSESLVLRDQGLCTTCHADLGAMGFGFSDLEPVTDFYDDHPPFKYSVLAWSDDEGWESKRLHPWDAEAADRSNLRFPHDVHMVAQGIESPQGTRVMACKNCHETEVSGVTMRPVTMERHCADCHQLTFDASAPDRVVPHGSVSDLMRTLREYYAWQFLDGQAAPVIETTPDQIRPARRPGDARRKESIEALLARRVGGADAAISRAGREFIEDRVAIAATNLFERQTCVVCHSIALTGDVDLPWQVLPVALVDDWFPLTKFSHERHKNMRCEGCHEASSSTAATDILMPDIGTCRACHGGERTRALLQSDCTTCHNFHLDNQAAMGELILIEELEAERRGVEGRPPKPVAEESRSQ